MDNRRNQDTSHQPPLSNSAEFPDSSNANHSGDSPSEATGFQQEVQHIWNSSPQSHVHHTEGTTGGAAVQRSNPSRLNSVTPGQTRAAINGSEETSRTFRIPTPRDEWIPLWRRSAPSVGAQSVEEILRIAQSDRFVSLASTGQGQQTVASVANYDALRRFDLPPGSSIAPIFDGFFRQPNRPNGFRGWGAQWPDHLGDAAPVGSNLEDSELTTRSEQGHLDSSGRPYQFWARVGPREESCTVEMLGNPRVRTEDVVRHFLNANIRPTYTPGYMHERARLFWDENRFNERFVFVGEEAQGATTLAQSQMRCRSRGTYFYDPRQLEAAIIRDRDIFENAQFLSEIHSRTHSGRDSIINRLTLNQTSVDSTSGGAAAGHFFQTDGAQVSAAEAAIMYEQHEQDEQAAEVRNTPLEEHSLSAAQETMHSLRVSDELLGHLSSAQTAAAERAEHALHGGAAATTVSENTALHAEEVVAEIIAHLMR